MDIPGKGRDLSVPEILPPKGTPGKFPNWPPDRGEKKKRIFGPAQKKKKPFSPPLVPGGHFKKKPFVGKIF
jgi:hypothetical protein